LGKEVIIVAGGNGVGKTTFALEFLLENPNYEFLNADETAKELSPENPQGRKISAGKIFFKKLAEYVRDGESFLIESTLSGRYLKKLIKELPKNGYQITIIFLFVDAPDILIERIHNRVAKGGHHIPDDDVKRRFWRGKENFIQSYKDFAHFWGLVYNTESGFIDVAEGQGGEIEIFDAVLYDKFMRL
jgi:predicted ABC-type ATPase